MTVLRQFSVLFLASTCLSPGKDTVLFLAGADTLAWGQHEHSAGSRLLAQSLEAAVPGVRTEVIREWPAAETLAAAKALVIYGDGHQFHPANARLDELERFMDAGGGLVVLHWATGIGGPGNEAHAGPEVAGRWRSLTGAGFEPRHSVSRIWTGDFGVTSHEVTRGVTPFRLHDECYFHLNTGGGAGFTPLLTAHPPRDLLVPQGETDFEGNSLARASVLERGEPQFVAWAFDRPAGGRAFGFAGGHFHWSWARDEVRKLVHNGIVWSTGATVPQGGVNSPTPSGDEMLANISGTNPGWTAPALQRALDRAARGELVRWKDFESTPLEQAPATAGPKLKQGNATDAPWLSAPAQQATFALAEGFSVELVTSEVEGTDKPVALAFDASGRLWTTTATEYPLDTNDPVHAEEARRKWVAGGRDRVLVIDRPEAPGPHTPRVFADGLVMPMGVLPVSGGAIVAHGPEMLMFRDSDGNGLADQRTVLLRGFGVQDSHTMAHGLAWLPDGSVLTVQGVLDQGAVTDPTGRAVAFNFGKFAAFAPDGTGFRLIGAGLNNTWGVLLQRNGRMWVQEANCFDHCIAPFEEGVHYHGWNEEPYIPHAPWQPGVGEVDLGSTGLSGLARSEDREGGFPPGWQERFLIANAVTGAINSVEAEVRPSGEWKVTRGPDLLTCGDSRFRPVHIAFGPDGCLYVVDWYNPIISHNEVPRDHPARDKTSGRIWRVRHVSQMLRPVPDVHAAADADLPRHLASPNTWEMRAAWREIVDRRASSLVPVLQQMLADSRRPDDVRIHAAWCLAGLAALTPAACLEVVPSASEDVAFELVRSLRTARVPAAAAAPVLRAALARPEVRVRREVARFLQTADNVAPDLLSDALGYFAAHPEDQIKAVQGSTLRWPAYQQAFLNSQLLRAVELQPTAASALAADATLRARLPVEPRRLLERRLYEKRFAEGAVNAADLADPGLRAAALASAATSAPAAAALREFAATADAAVFGRELLDDPAVTPEALRAFAAPLALRLMRSEEGQASADGLDLAAHACTAADGAEFLSAAAGIFTHLPERRLHLVRTAVAAGIRQVAFYESVARDGQMAPAVRAAAWPGWFESADAAAKPGVEAALREWAATLSAESAAEVLSELAATTVGTHFALNNVFPALSAADPAALARLTDELAERVPTHGRLAPLRALVERHRTSTSAAAKARVEALLSALASRKLQPDPAAGAPFFASLCLSCHSAAGRGVGFAPPLDGSGKRDTESLLTAIISPEAAVENVFRPWHVRLRSGQVIEGFLKSRDGNRMVIQSMGGETHTVDMLRTHTARYVGGHSLMPALASALSDQQIADVIAVLRKL